MAQEKKRAYMSGRFALEIDNNSAGWVYSADGGTRSAEVVSEKSGGELLVRKHIGGLKYDDINITCGTGMTKSFYRWMKDSLDFNYQRKHGVIHAADYDFGIRSSLEFYHGLLSEIGFPALDAASKDAAKFTLKITPEYTKTQRGNGKVTLQEHNINQKKQQQWLPSNFRLRMDGLDEATKYVNKIEALSFKQKITSNALGETHVTALEPTAMEYPNLVITLPESCAEPFFKWEKSFLVQGNCSQDDEKTATLEYLNPNLDTVLFTITMKNIGIFKLTPDKLEAGSENLRRVKAEMYVEEYDFNYSSAAVWA